MSFTVHAKRASWIFGIAPFYGLLVPPIPSNRVVANLVHSIPRSEDKFRSVGKWPAFRKSASPESISLIEDDFGGSEIQCMKCQASIGNLYHDGKKSGDDHAEAKDRHCVESDAVVFEALDLDEPAPEAPAEPSRQISLDVVETTEAPVSMPAGMTQPTPTSTPQKSSRASSRSTPAATPAATPASTPAAAPASDSRTPRKSVARIVPPNATAQRPQEAQQEGVSATVIGVVAVAAVAIVGIGAWLGLRRANSKK